MANPSPTIPANDLSKIEDALFRASNLASVLHSMLDKIEPMSEGGNLLRLEEAAHFQLCFLAHETRKAISEAESCI